MFVVHEVLSAELGRVTLQHADPRDGPLEAELVTAGNALQVALVLLSRCSTADLHRLRLYFLPGIQRQVAGEDKARAALEREGAKSGVIPTADVQREFDRAVAEEWAEFGDGTWREDHGEETRGPIGQGGGS